MKISASTKISALLKFNPASLEAIVSINKHFEKLRNPVLRKVLASRVTIAEAAKIGKCSIDIFFDKLKAIGFEIENNRDKINMKMNPIPEFVNTSTESNTTELDVREEIRNGRDPFQIIMKAIDELPENFTLLLINSFEPVPLIKILNNKGFLHFVKYQEDGAVYTYLKKQDANSPMKIEIPVNDSSSEFISLFKQYCGKLKTIDVRNLEMPLPMTTILGELESLPNDMALFVHHKKVPQFLFPELQERNFKWSIEEKTADEVDLLIYK